MDGLAIREEKKGYPDSRWQKRLSASFAYASLACSLLFWLDLGLAYLYVHLRLRILEWLVVFPAWKWVLIEAFGLLLAIVAAALHVHSKLWRIAIPVSFLMFVFTMYVMGS